MSRDGFHYTIASILSWTILLLLQLTCLHAGCLFFRLLFWIQNPPMQIGKKKIFGNVEIYKYWGYVYFQESGTNTGIEIMCWQPTTESAESITRLVRNVRRGLCKPQSEGGVKPWKIHILYSNTGLSCLIF